MDVVILVIEKLLTVYIILGWTVKKRKALRQDSPICQERVDSTEWIKYEKNIYQMQTRITTSISSIA